MHISIICFSLTGYTTAEKIQKSLQQCGYTADLFKKSKYLEDSIAENTAVWTGHHFKTDDGLIFVGACGIAVRSIAPYVASKKSDPAVLVVDECGKFVISLLSGHLGGANALALKTAGTFDDVPNGAWYTDAVTWAAENGVVAGIGNGRFDPDGSVTREQTAVILFNYAQSKGYDVSARADLSVFPDAGSVSGWAQDALAWANASGLISGAVRGTQTILDPQGSASRAQVAMILMGYVEHVVNA